MNINYLENKIIFESSKTAFIILMGIAVIFIIISFVIWNKPNGNIQTIKYIILSFGILFGLFSILFIAYQRNIKILVNEPTGKISFKEMINGKYLDVEMSLNNFKRLDIYQSKTTSNSNKKTAPKYEINLIKNNNSPAWLNTFESLNKTIEFVHKFTSISDIPVNIYLSKAYDTTLPQNLPSQVTVLYESPIETWKQAQNEDISTNKIDYNYKLPDNCNLKKIQQGNDTILTWSASSNFLSSLIFALVGLTFVFIIARLVVPSKGMGFGAIIGFLISGVFTLISTFMLIYSIWGFPRLCLKEDSVCYETYIFNKRLYNQCFSYQNIRMVWNSMNTGEKNEIVLFSGSGLDSFFSAYNIENINFSNIVGTAMAMKSSIMTIDTRPLSYVERLEIEQLIISKIQEK